MCVCLSGVCKRAGTAAEYLTDGGFVTRLRLDTALPFLDGRPSEVCVCPVALCVSVSCARVFRVCMPMRCSSNGGGQGDQS